MGVVAAAKPRRAKVLLAAALAMRAARLRMMMELLLQNIIEVVGVEVCYGEGGAGGKGEAHVRGEQGGGSGGWTGEKRQGGVIETTE